MDLRFKLFIRIGMIAVIWSLWLCRNDKVFSDKNASLMQVIYRCTATLYLWSYVHRVEHRDLFMEVCIRLEDALRDTFTLHRWQHNLRIGHPSPYAPFFSAWLACR